MRPTYAIPDRTGIAKPWYRNLWPWLLMLGPIAVILAGTYTCWLAFSRQDALVVDDYYKQGKAINQDLRRDHAAAGLGLALSMRYDPATNKLFGTIVSFGTPVAERMRLHLIHSTQSGKDLNLEMQPGPGGEFSIALPMLEKAQWQVLLENERRDWRLGGAWAWPRQQKIEIKADPAPAE